MLKLHLLHVKTIFVLLLFLNIIHVNICSGSSSFLDLNSVKTSDLTAMVKRGCAGKISECPGMADEDEMDSESNRRVLAMHKRYISYDTLKRDSVPCTKPGASYYDCRARGEANHYNRGCEEITRCARQVSDTKS